MIKTETLTLPSHEVRFATEEDAGTFSGYASVFGEPDSYGDTIAPGAFAKTIGRRSSGPVAMFWNHNPDEPIGTWASLEEDTRGLKVSGKLVTATTRGADTLALLKAGAVSGLSIGFRALAAGRGPNGGRVLTQIELVEISVVSLPAASKARITNVKGAGSPVGAAAFLTAIRLAATAIKRAV